MTANKEVAVAPGNRGERFNRLMGTVFYVNQRMGAFALYIYMMSEQLKYIAVRLRPRRQMRRAGPLDACACDWPS